MSLFNRVASRIVVPTFLLVSGSLFVLAGCGDNEATEGAEGTEAAAEGNSGGYGVNGRFASVEDWGENLVVTLGCNDCHSSKVWGPEGPKIDQSLMLAGHPADMPLPDHDPALIGMGPDNWILAVNNFTAYVGPWGTSYARNLTPDQTGLGSWTEEQFMTAMKGGWFQGMEGTRKLLPPMPWEAYAQLSDEEVRAIFAYLKSIPPVENVVPAAVMAGPPPEGAPGGEAPEGEAAPEDASDSGA